MYNLRWLEEKDYETLCKWWKDWRWTPPARELLPDNGKCGVMVSKDGVEICAGFIYLTNSKFAIVEYVVSNFEVKDKEVRQGAIKLVIDGLSEIGKQEGYKLAFTSLKNPSLQKLYVDRGYQVGSNNTVELIKAL